MRRSVWTLGLALAWVSCSAACASSVNVEQERNALLALDREWSQTTKDMNKFISYYAPDASAYPQGMPVATGSVAIMDAFMKMSSAPGFSLQWTPVRADVSAAGDVGYTVGTYEASMNGATEKGKYVEVWKKQSDGTWKVKEDIFNADTAGPPPSKPVMLAASALTWGDAPPVLPAGAKMAVVSLEIPAKRSCMQSVCRCLPATRLLRTGIRLTSTSPSCPARFRWGWARSSIKRL